MRVVEIQAPPDNGSSGISKSNSNSNVGISDEEVCAEQRVGPEPSIGTMGG